MNAKAKVRPDEVKIWLNDLSVGPIRIGVEVALKSPADGANIGYFDYVDHGFVGTRIQLYGSPSDGP